MSEAQLAEVLLQVQAGDAAAWGELYGQYAPSIFRFCRHVLPVREDAEDATVEIFIKVRQKIGSFDSSRPFRAWLFKVASNHCWDMLRRRRAQRELETAAMESRPLADPDPDQLERLQAQFAGEEVRKGLAKLPDRSRMALVLRYYAEMNYREIAEEIGVRRQLVGVLLLRARRQLREALEGPGRQNIGGSA